LFRLVTLASGAAAGKFLQYEENAPSVAVQTAYGIEAEVEGYEGGEEQEVVGRPWKGCDAIH
jgi:lycopene epsilon-cyclase